MAAQAKDADSMHDLFASIANKIEGASGGAVQVPEIKPSVLEWYAGRFNKHGYEVTAEVVSAISDYLKGYNIWLCGNVGIGKTFFFETMSKIRVGRGAEPIVKLSMIETQGWDMTSAREWAEDHRQDDVLIDDVGVEPIMKSWGQEAELFPYLLEKRMQATSVRTHLTSNLGPLDVKRRYGDRVIDRCVQMFKMIALSARKSKRRQKPWKVAKDNGAVI